METRFYSKVFMWTSLLIVKGIIRICDGFEASSEHADIARKLVAQGQKEKALVRFTNALNFDPFNVELHWERFHVALDVYKFDEALSDLDDILDFDPSDLEARSSRAATNLRLGDISAANLDFTYLLKYDKTRKEAKKVLDQISDLQFNIRRVFRLYETEKCGEALNLLKHVVEMCPWDTGLREIHAECSISVGKPEQAVDDYKQIIRFGNQRNENYVKLASLEYQTGDLKASISTLQECLQIYQEDELCLPVYKKTKKVKKDLQKMEQAWETKQWKDCVKYADVASLGISDKMKPVIFSISKYQCLCQKEIGNTVEVITACSKALQIQDDYKLLRIRADAFVEEEYYEEAIRDYKRIVKQNRVDKDVKIRLEHAQSLQRETQAGRRDYYRILGVPRNATNKEINTAYREKSLKWHPDKYKGSQEKAHKKFLDINDARTVLLDEAKRRLFDRGSDPFRRM